jgi:Mce-associated membrane protein
VSVETDPVTDPDDADIARKTSDGQKADDVHDGEPDVDSETAELDDTGGGEGEADAKGTGIDHAEAEQDAAEETPAKVKRRINWSRILMFGVVPGLALLLALGAGYLKWYDWSTRSAESARVESVQAAKDSTVALLSYRPDTVEKDLIAARDRLTGDFKNAYTQLTQDVVIPGSKQQNITATAAIPAAASVSATRDHAVVLVFIDQSTTIGTNAPSNLQSSVRVTLEKAGTGWLISGFDPV